jgi:excisionase family DNA binding protein
MAEIVERETELISVAEAARLANVSYLTIWRRVRDGSLPALRVGQAGVIRIRRDAFNEFLYGENA